MLGRKSKKRTQNSGLGQAPAFSYYRGQAQVPSAPRGSDGKKTRSLGQWLTILPSLAALAACAGVVLYNLYVKPGAVLQADGQNLYRPLDIYKQGVKDILGSSFLYRSKITIDSEKIEQKILETYPEISSVSVAIPLVGHEPVVGIRFAEPKLKFVSSGKQMVLDKSGKVLPLEDVSANLPVVTDDSGISYKIGDRALTRQEVSYIAVAAAEMTANGRKIASIRIGTAPKEFSLQFDGEAYFVKLSFEYPIRQQLGAMWATLDRLGGDKPKTYLDVRLGERVFVL